MKYTNYARRLFYQSVAEQFDSLYNQYDLHRRLSIVFDELLSSDDLQGKLMLDAGCGSGEFSLKAVKQAAKVVSCDIAENIVRIAARKAFSIGVVGDACRLPFRSHAFDLVISSEMIEHTEAPYQAFGELVRVLKPGGFLVTTTPNKAWQWLVKLATRLHIRPFQGFENFLSWREVEALCSIHGLCVLKHVGFHPWPFQFRLWKLSAWVDRHFGKSSWAKAMINQASLARKPDKEL